MPFGVLWANHKNIAGDLRRQSTVRALGLFGEHIAADLRRKTMQFGVL